MALVVAASRKTLRRSCLTGTAGFNGLRNLCPKHLGALGIDHDYTAGDNFISLILLASKNCLLIDRLEIVEML